MHGDNWGIDFVGLWFWNFRERERERENVEEEDGCIVLRNWVFEKLNLDSTEKNSRDEEENRDLHN